MSNITQLQAAVEAGDVDAVRRLDEAYADRNETVYAAARRFAGDCYDALADNAGHFSCHETESIVALLQALDVDPSTFLDAHARADEEGDAHYIASEVNRVR